MAVLQFEGQVFHIFAYACIGESHIPEFNVGGVSRGFFCQQYRQIFRLCQHIGHPFGAGFTLGPHNEDPSNAQHSVENISKILQEGHDDAAFHLTGIYPVSAHHYGQRQTQIQHQRSHRIGDACDRTGLHGDIRQIPVDPVKSLFFVVGLAQSLDHPDTGDVFLHSTHHIIQHILLVEMHGNTVFCYQVCHDSNDGQKSNEDQRQLGIHTQHQHHAADKQHGRTNAHSLKASQ